MQLLIRSRSRLFCLSELWSAAIDFFLGEVCESNQTVSCFQSRIVGHIVHDVAFPPDFCHFAFA
jgi:hypothetical protein